MAALDLGSEDPDLSNLFQKNNNTGSYYVPLGNTFYVKTLLMQDSFFLIRTWTGYVWFGPVLGYTMLVSMLVLKNCIMSIVHHL